MRRQTTHLVSQHPNYIEGTKDNTPTTHFAQRFSWGAARRQNSPRRPRRLTEGAGTAKQHGKSPAEPKETRWLDQAHKGTVPLLDRLSRTTDGPARQLWKAPGGLPCSEYCTHQSSSRSHRSRKWQQAPPVVCVASAAVTRSGGRQGRKNAAGVEEGGLPSDFHSQRQPHCMEGGSSK